MTQRYEPVEWTDETPTQPGTLINKARLDQMQSAHHFADGFEEVDAIPAEDPGTDYHKVVYCTADSTFYRWDGTQWTADIDDDTKRLLEEHEADHANPHQVTKAQVGLGNADNTSDADKPISTATAAALATKAEDSTVVHLEGAETIDGKKTFTKNPVVSGAPPALTLINTLDTWVSPPSADAYASIGFSDKNNAAVGSVGTVHKTGTGERRTYLSARTSGGSVTAELDVVISSDGSTKYATAPARAYNAANTGDVVTIGTLATPLALKADDNAVVHLNGAETIPGAKTFSGQMLATGQHAYDPANTTDVATIGTLDQYTPMVRTVNNQTINGIKTFLLTAVNNQKWRVQNNNEGVSTVPASQVQTQPLDVADANGAQIYFDQMLTNNDGSRAWRQNLYGTGGHRMILHMQVNADGTGFLTAPYRAYNTANTTDVATIGTIKNSTDVVHTSGNEDVGGRKTFLVDPVVKADANPGLETYSPSFEKGSTFTQFTRPFLIVARGGSNNATLALIQAYAENNDRRGMDMTLYGKNNAAQLSLKEYNGTTWMQAPHRAYNANNTDDVATIATLDGYTPMVRTSGNQNIAGIKLIPESVVGTRMVDRVATTHALEVVQIPSPGAGYTYLFHLLVSARFDLFLMSVAVTIKNDGTGVGAVATTATGIYTLGGTRQIVAGARIADGKLKLSLRAKSGNTSISAMPINCNMDGLTQAQDFSQYGNVTALANMTGYVEEA